MRKNEPTLWREFVVESLCGLCGNMGRMPSVDTVSPAGKHVHLPAGRFCICPNGRTLRGLSKEEVRTWD